jgi:hypothetical protein
MKIFKSPIVKRAVQWMLIVIVSYLLIGFILGILLDPLHAKYEVTFISLQDGRNDLTYYTTRPPVYIETAEGETFLIDMGTAVTAPPISKVLFGDEGTYYKNITGYAVDCEVKARLLWISTIDKDKPSQGIQRHKDRLNKGQIDGHPLQMAICREG